MQDSKRRLYKREDYDLITFLGDVGGLLEFLFFLGLALTSPFVARLFYASLVSQIYRI